MFLKSEFNNKNNLKKKMSLKRRGSKKKKPLIFLQKDRVTIIEYVQVMKTLPLERNINVSHLSELVQVSIQMSRLQFNP